MRVRCVCVIAAPQQPCVRVEKPERGKGQKEKEKHRGMVAPKPHSHHPALPSSRRVTRAREGARALHTHTHTHSLSSHPLRTPWHPRGSPSSGERGGGGGREGATRADLPPPLFFSSSSKTSRWTVHLPSSPFFSTTQPHARSPARSRTPRPRLHLGPGRLECGLQEVAVGPAAGWWGWRE